MPQGKKGGNQQQGGQKENFSFDLGGKQLSKEATDLLLQGKFGNLIGASSGYFETLPKSVQTRVKALKTLQAKSDAFEEDFRKEMKALEEKYNKLKNPLFARRAEIVNGSEVNAEEQTAIKALDEKEKKEDKPEGEKKPEVPAGDDIKGIPDFWLEVFKHHPHFAEMITDKDEPILKNLKNIESFDLENDEESFGLKFTFAPNEYFNEEVITKTYHLAEDHGEIMFQKVEVSDITWKEGKNVTVKMVTKQQKVGGGKGGRGKGGRGGKGGKQQTKTVTVEEPQESFFNFFKPPNIDEEEELDEEDQEAIQQILEEDYSFGVTIKEDLIENAVNWYTGEAEIDDDMMMPGFGGEYDDEEEDGDEDEKEYDSEEDDDFDPKAAAPTGGAGAAAQPECKQQ